MSNLLIRTADLFTIIEKIVEQLSRWHELLDAGAEISHSERIPEDPARCPWVGIYQIRSDYQANPRVLGMGSGYRRGQHTFAAVMMQANADSGRECKRDLERLVRSVTSALLTDPTLGGLVDIMETFAVDYEFLPTSSGFIQQAILRFTVTGNTSAETV